MHECAECGFVYASVSELEIPNALHAFGTMYRAHLEGKPAVLRTRPSPEHWSVLEYACHVRDVLVVQRDRLGLALIEDAPSFVPMGRDERVLRDRYNDQVPAVVVDQLEAAADALAADFARLRRDQWTRTGIYNWPTPGPRSMTWLGQHTIHEQRHHLGDIDAVLARVT